MRYMKRVRVADHLALPAVGLPARSISTPRLDAPSDRVHTETSPRAERVASLDILRGLMALAVAVYHLGVWTRAFSGSAARSAVVILGVYGVEGFFLISGFCFFHLYARTSFSWPELWRFHVKRFFRIAPLYYCAVLLGLALSVEQATVAHAKPVRLLENFTLSFGLVHPNHSMVMGGWSIGIEYVFYLAFPLLVWLSRSRLVLYGLALGLVLWALRYNSGAVAAAAEADKFHAYVQLPNHAFLFLLGAIVADLRARIALRLTPLALLGLLASIGVYAARAQPEFLDHVEVMEGLVRVKYAALCALTVLFFAFTKLPALRAMRALGWLGDLSYSVYLMHPFAWLLVEPLLAPALPPLARLGIGLCAALGLAHASWHLIERPCNALGHRLAR